MLNRQTLNRLAGTLAVSCQADAVSPLASPIHIVALAEAAILGGASAVRIEGIENIAAVRKAVTVPIIGLVKRKDPSSDIYITPEISDVVDAAAAGADIIAFDATIRKRPCPVQDIVGAIHRAGKFAMADVSTAEEGAAAIQAGADIVSTTMAGYTKQSQITVGPDFALMKELAARKIPYVAEGRIWTLEEAQKCLELGSFFIVIGSAITRPDVIAERFVRHISQGQDVLASKVRVSK